MKPMAVRLRPFEEGDLWYFDRQAKDREFSGFRVGWLHVSGVVFSTGSAHQRIGFHAVEEMRLSPVRVQPGE